MSVELTGDPSPAPSPWGDRPAPSAPAAPDAGPRGFGRRWLRVVPFALAILLALPAVVRAVWMPDPARTPELVRHPRIVVEARGESRFDPPRATLEIALPVPLAEVSPAFVELLLFDEDRRFFEHHGVDPRGMARGLARGLSGGDVEGGSTITQQLVKNIYLSGDRSVPRKLLDIALAPLLELSLDKNTILEAYVNHAFFGNDLYGVEAAARGYFGVRARCLDPMQAAMLVRTLKSPSRLNPLRGAALLRREARDLLARYRAARGALRAPAAPARRCRLRSDWPPARRFYARDAALAEVAARYADRLGDAPFVAWSTLEPELQLYAELAVDEALAERKRLGFDQIALVAMTPDGRVRALVGGDDYGRTPWDRARLARRQPGSAFKPLVYLAALEAGVRMDDLLDDRPRAFEGYVPRNIDGRYLGRISVHDALVFSRNAATVALAEGIGRWRVHDLARRLGYRGRLPDDPTMALGSGEVTLVDLVALFASLVDGGRPVEPRFVEALRFRRGGFLALPDRAAGPPVVDRRHLCNLLDALGDVVREPEGTGHRALFAGGHPVIGKTGTSQQHRDAWFVGATAHLVAGVWIGRDDDGPTKGATGGDLPARTFARFMVNAHLGLEPRPIGDCG